jgi:hypothetical protein
MRYWLPILVVMIVGLVFPLFAEDSTSSCDAAETRLLGDNSEYDPTTGFWSLVFQRLSRGQVARVAARQYFPRLPVGITCYILYYRALFLGPDAVLPDDIEAALLKGFRPDEGDAGGAPDTTPPADDSAGTAPDPTYKPGTRQNLDQLIQNSDN